ncbi:LysR family transcriptional regulator [Shewanella sp. AS16]|uniref:LysR family transcriptional regulator n=1 Tax=Shewanella sp. AS16 TaxID=2907625 RepID=UPI001F3AD284|nr:LysR family transcriptional regulator [Shewanella sp. AS16]MCE9684786.1 LysR family transcriptional regulator [Shewanella sp. AS16]
MYLWEGISEFVAVAENESFTLAARHLDISTAHVSRQVAALENRLGTKLFYRTTRKVSLTEEGGLYYRHCRQLQTGLEEAERAITSLSGTPQGLVKLTAPVAYGEKYIMPLLSDFMVRYPSIELSVDLTNRTVDLVEAGYDLAIRLGKLADSSLVAKPLSARTHYVCAAPAYLATYGEPHSLSELGRHNCLIGNHNYWRFIDAGKERNIKVRGRLACNSGYALRDAAIKAIGLVQLPDYYVDADLQAGRLVSVLNGYREAREGIWALYPQNRHLSPKVRLLVDFLAQRLAEQDAARPNAPQQAQ